MSKQTRREKREEEARIIAELNEALQTESTESATEQKQGNKYETTPEIMHCKRCKTPMENGVCPVCGYRVYTPMDEDKRKRIRLIAAIAGIAVFLVLFFILK